MARQEYIDFVPASASIENGSLVWKTLQHQRPIESLPQLFWADGSPWREANLWLMLQGTSAQKDIQTLKSKSSAIHGYMKWLEVTGTDWRDFPARESERCLVKFRGHLVRARKSGDLAPSTASQRMRVVIQFYRWLRVNGALSPEWPMWRDSYVNIKYSNAYGLERTVTVNTTSLSIPNRSPVGEKLEDGLYPVSEADRAKILDAAKEHCTHELWLMLMCGFFTGMRVQTITDLKISTLINAVPDPASDELYRLAVGPGASPPVATKGGVTGHVLIPKVLLDELLTYCYDPERLKREAKARTENKEHVFLTKNGNLYAERNKDRSPALNTAMSAFRRIGKSSGISALHKFKFHQTRCTFATDLARLAIKAGGAIHAIAIVKDALLHADEKTTLKYIKFVEKSPIKASIANEFTRAFFNSTIKAIE
ncbi:site-specific integrase [Pseudomonas sp. HD6515]|uniref:tyrosine-type recombinase/integrase n=1 Tax=Pseudomonas sp. HD6515 TaxID=2856556 RepID=UPI00217E8E9B|nr:site-specific integrase [Pseudomonas sp. HD6515]